jgi:hypothetical protein
MAVRCLACYLTLSGGTPVSLSPLAGLSTRIYQTVHDGALAFLVVVSSSHKSKEESQKKSEDFATSSRYSYLHGENQEFESLRAHRLFFQSEARIKPEADDGEDEELHNSQEPDLTRQEMTDLSPEVEIEGGPEIHYFIDEDGNIHSREFLAEGLIPNEVKSKTHQKGGQATRKLKD